MEAGSRFLRVPGDSALYRAFFRPLSRCTAGSKLALPSGPRSGFIGGQVPVPGREAALALAWGLAMGPLSQMSCKYHLAERKRKEEL